MSRHGRASRIAEFQARWASTVIASSGAVLLDHITSRWGMLILLALSSGTMRWGELRRWAKEIVLA